MATTVIQTRKDNIVNFLQLYLPIRKEVIINLKMTHKYKIHTV